MARLEHLNVTVADAKAFAETLCTLFDWHIRWEGTTLNGGYSVLVGEADSYVALYAPVKILDHMKDTTTTSAGLNHLGVVVDDIDATEARVIAAGYEPNRHADYEPGRRFYFVAESGVEIEVAQYD